MDVFSAPKGHVQKCALKIILGDKYISYTNALASTQLEPLDVRRNQLCLTFALKAEKSQKFEKWFKEKLVELQEEVINIFQPMLKQKGC